MKTPALIWFACLITLRCPADPGQIVLLNGTSSAGKTSLAEAMVSESKTKYEVVSFDGFIASYRQIHPLQSDRAQYQSDFTLALYTHAKEKADAGKNVIIDTVEFDRNYGRYCEILDCFKVVKAIVYC